MEESIKKDNKKKENNKKRTFPVPFALEVIKESITITSKTRSNPSKEQIINQAFKFHSEGNISEAAKYYQYFISQGFNDHIVFSNYGMLFHDKGDLNQAESLFRKAIELNPNYVDANFNLGTILMETGKYAQAESLFRKAIVHKPDHVEAHLNLGNILKDIGNLREAEISTRKAIELKPNYAYGYYNLGNILKDIGNLREAETSIRKAIQLKPDFAEAHSNLGDILKDIGNLKEAEISTRKAIEFNHDLAIAHSNLGTILKEQGRIKEAEKYIRNAISLRPEWAEVHNTLATILIKLKKFKEGWNQFEWRWLISNLKGSDSKRLKTSKPEWDPQFRGRVLLWAEQGIGDEIFFASIIPELLEKVDHLIVKVDRRLIALFMRSFDQNIVYVNKDEFVDEDNYDFQIAMGSLPKLFRETEESFERVPQNYLKVDDIKTKNIRNKIKTYKYEKIVGISWKTIATGGESKTRSLQLEEFILGIYSPNINFVCLQYGDVEEEIHNLKVRHGVEIELAKDIDKFNDIDSLSCLISACDEIVSIDNSTAILASAIGSKCNLLIPINSHWYWGFNDIKSDWFPSVKLFRKQNLKTWNEPLKFIKKQINPSN